MCFRIAIIGAQEQKGSDQQVIDSLIEVKVALQDQIHPLNVRLETIQLKLDSIEGEKLALELSKLMEKGIGVVLNSDGKFRPSPSPLAEVIDFIPKGSKVTVVKHHEGYYETVYKGKKGWLSSVYFNSSPELEKFAGKKVSAPGSNRSLYLSKPSTTARSSSSSTSSKSGKCTARQCSGYTQKGSRCRNSTTNCSGRCHVH